MTDNIESPLNGKSTFAESSLGHLLDKPLDAAFLPRKLRAFPKELADKFGLPQELCLLAILSFASAHLGHAFRLGDGKEWGPGLGNLRFAVGMDREADLTPLFRTLGSCLFRGERHGFGEYNRNRAKPPTLKEQAAVNSMAIEDLANDEIDIGLRLQGTARLTECFLGRTRPNFFLDDHIPEQWGEIAGESSAESLFALGSRGVAVRKFLDGSLNSGQREIFLHVLSAGWLEESFKARTGRRSWAFADQLCAGAFWALPSPLLRAALGNEQMRSERLWDSFLLAEIEMEGGVPKIRPGTALPSLRFWRERTNAFQPVRMTVEEHHVPVHFKAVEVFDQMADELTKALPQLPPETRSFALDWNVIAHKVAGVLHLLEN
jgi:hypothetical protein